MQDVKLWLTDSGEYMGAEEAAKERRAVLPCSLLLKRPIRCRDGATYGCTPTWLCPVLAGRTTTHGSLGTSNITFTPNHWHRERVRKTQRGRARAVSHPTLGLTARPGNGEGTCWEGTGRERGGEGDGHGRRSARARATPVCAVEFHGWGRRTDEAAKERLPCSLVLK